MEVNEFDVTAVSDGGAALAALQAAASPGGEPFDVGILDMCMPVLTGPQVAISFRAWESERPHLARTPLVALTANALEEHAAECAAAGCDAFITKPLRADSMAVLRVLAAQAAERRALAAAADQLAGPAA
jgi:CheY-like chemotaxis protein